MVMLNEYKNQRTPQGNEATATEGISKTGRPRKRRGVRGWTRHCVTSRMVAGSIPDGVIGNFQCQFFRHHYGSGVDSTSTSSEYQGISWGVKLAGAKS